MNTQKTNNKSKDMTLPGSHRNPFKVPEGYFNTLPERVMQSINQEEQAQKLSLVRHRRSLFLMRMGIAAALTGVFIFAGMLAHQHRNAVTSGADAVNFAQQLDLDYNDETLEYAMLDNNDIEYYLTVAE